MKRFFCLISFIVITTAFVHAQSFWTGLNGPFGGTINDMVSPSAGVMIVTTANGAYRSTDSGATWARLTLGSDNSISDLEVDPNSSGNKIYAATNNGARVYVSLDAGVTWSQLSTSGVLFVVAKIKVTPNGTIYMTDNGLRLLKSTNNGVSFTNISLGVTVNDLDVDNSNNLYISTSGQGIKVTADGTSFNTPSTGSLTGSSTVYSTVINGSSIFALASDGPHKSTDSGSTYTSIKSNVTDISFSGLIDTDGTGNIYLVNNSYSKIWTSTSVSAGTTWTLGVAYPYPFAANSSYFQSTTTWYIGFGQGGLFKTSTTGTSWTPSSSGIKSIAATNKLFITPTNNYLFMGWSGGLGYFSSTNNGTTWTLNASTAANTNRYLNGFIKLADNSILGYGNGAVRSTNEGGTWTQQSTQGLNELVYDGTNLFSYSGVNLLKSIDQGVTWTPTAMTGLGGTPNKIQVDAAGNLYFNVGFSEVDKVNPTTGIATKLNNLTATSVQDIQVVGTGIYVLGNGNTLNISTDGGQTFLSKVTPASSSALWVYDSKNMFLRTTSNNFYISNDGGGIWTSQPLLDTQGSATDAIISPLTYLYVATSKSVMHKSTKVVLPPAAPTALSVIGTSFDQVQLLWNDNSINEDDYVIEISTGDNQHYTAPLSSPLFGPTTNVQNKINYTYTGLTKNILYFFRVKAINSVASSAYSNEVSVTTIDQCATTIPNNRSWTATSVADPGSTASGPGPFTSPLVNIVVIANTVNQFTISNYDLGVNPSGPMGTAVFVESCGKIYFSDQGNSIGNGNGTWIGTTLVLHWQADVIGSSFFQGTTTLTLNTNDPIPAAPSLNAYLYSGTEVLLNWNVIPFAGQYDIKRATVSGGPYTIVATVNYPAVTYIDKSLTTGTSYYYGITAKNTAGTSASSPEAGILLQNGLFRPVENDIQLNFENQQGVSWGDLDGDGDEDIASPSFVNNAGQNVPPVFYENMGNGKDFTRRDLPVLTNENTAISRGINIFDYNNDGKLDIYITRSGNNVADLRLINNGSWNFTKQAITETIPFNNAFRSSAAADYDKDGKVDIFVGNDSFTNPATERGQLFKNSGGTSYAEILTGSLVADLNNANNVSWADYDNDGDQDIFVHNDGAGFASINRLYKNNGDGTFTRVTGLIFDTDSFLRPRTSSWGDIDNDGDLDLYVGSQAGGIANYDRLYQNNGDGTFTSLTSNVVAEIGTNTYGSSFGDIDNDGDLDLIVINSGANSVFLNNGTGMFTKYGVQEMITHPAIFEIGGSIVDFDQDGFLDVYPPKGFTNTVDLPNFLYKNTATASPSKNWIEVRLAGVQSNSAAIGARVIVTTTSPARTQIREISTRTGYGSANSLIAHFGLGTATTVTNIQVKWPSSGIIQNLANVTSNQLITIKEDNTPPVVTLLNPTNAATGVPFNTKLEITFNETPVGVAGKKVSLYVASNLVTPVQQFDAATGTISGNKVSFTPGAGLLANTSYKVIVDDGAFTDIYSNSFLGSALVWQFISLDTTPPVFGTPAVTYASLVSKGFSSAIFNVSVSDNVSVSSVVMSYRGAGTSGSYTTLAGVFNAGSGKWDFAMQESFYNATGLEFYFTAKDPDNNSARNPVLTYQSLYETTPPAITVPSSQPTLISKGFGTQTFSIAVTDNFSVSSVTMSYRDTKSGVAYSNISGVLNATVVSQYDFPVPETAFNGDGLEFYFTAADPTGNTARSPALATSPNTYKTLLDNQAPTVGPFSAAASIAKSNTTFTVKTVDNVSVSSVVMKYRGIASKIFITSAPGTKNASGDYDFAISQDWFDGMGLEYYFRAVDPSKNIGTSPDTTTASNKYYKTLLKFDGANLVKLDLIKGSATASGYQIISVPLELSNKNIADNFGGLGTADNTAFRFLRYHETPSPGWDEYPGGGLSELNRGEGYFLNSIKATQITLLSGVAPAFDQSNPFVLNLKKGWNEIGNPYTVAIQWSDVLTYNLNPAGVGKLVKYDNGYNTNDTNGIIEPYKGGFVQVDNDVALKIPFKGFTTGGRIGNESTELDQPSWQIPFSFSQQGLDYKVAMVGMDPDALPGKDNFDLPVVPRLNEFIEASFAHPEYFMKYFSQDVVTTQVSYTWEFSVNSNLAGIAEMTWDNTKFGDSAKELYLMDENLQKPVNMRESSVYHFDPKQSDKFKIYFGENLEKKIMPSRVHLGQAYPNPTAGTTSIDFTLPEQSTSYQVNLEVYDLMGKKIATVVNDNLTPGFYATEWDATQNALSNGLYTFRLVVIGEKGRDIKSEKVILRK